MRSTSLLTSRSALTFIYPRASAVCQSRGAATPGAAYSHDERYPPEQQRRLASNSTIISRKSQISKKDVIDEPRTIHFSTLSPPGLYVASDIACLPNAPKLVLITTSVNAVHDYVRASRKISFRDGVTGASLDVTGIPIELVKNGAAENERRIASFTGTESQVFYGDKSVLLNNTTWRMSENGLRYERIEHPDPISILICTGKEAGTTDALRALRHRLSRNSTVLLASKCIGQRERLISNVFTDISSRPNLVYGLIHHQVEPIEAAMLKTADPLIRLEHHVAAIESRNINQLIYDVVGGFEKGLAYIEELTPQPRFSPEAWMTYMFLRSTLLSCSRLRMLPQSPEAMLRHLAGTKITALVLSPLCVLLKKSFYSLIEDMKTDPHTKTLLEGMLNDIATILDREFPDCGITRQFLAHGIEWRSKVWSNKMSLPPAVTSSELGFPILEAFILVWLKDRAAHWGLDCPFLTLVLNEVEEVTVQGAHSRMARSMARIAARSDLGSTNDRIDHANKHVEPARTHEETGAEKPKKKPGDRKYYSYEERADAKLERIKNRMGTLTHSDHIVKPTITGLGNSNLRREN